MKLGGFLKKSDLFILSKITLLAHQVVTGQSKPTALRNQREADFLSFFLQKYEPS